MPAGARMLEAWIIGGRVGRLPCSQGPVGGSANRHAQAWRERRVSRWALKILERGAPSFFHGQAPPPKVLCNPHLSPEKQSIVNDWLALALREGIVERISRRQVDVISPIFIIPKKTPGQFRLVFDLRYVNSFQSIPKQRYTDLRTIRFMIEPGDWMTSVDLREGFAHVEASEELKRSLGFRWNGGLFRYKTLPFGLRSSPLVFNKLLAQSVAILRKKGVRLAVYVDDFLILARSEEQARAHTALVIETLSEMGWQINADKSDLTPRTRCPFLGVILDSDEGTISIPATKKQALAHELRRFARKAELGPIPKRIAARVMGLVSSVSPGLRFAGAFTRKLNCDMKLANPGWDSCFAVGKDARQDLLLLADLVANAKGEPLVEATPSWTMTTDASSTGWGAWRSDTDDRISAPFPSAHNRSSNHLELKAVLLALRRWKSQLHPGQTIAVQSDNTTTVAYLKRLQGRIPALNRIARKILQLTQERGIRILPTHVPGVENSIADELSRRNHEWGVTREAFKRLSNALLPDDTLQIDRFAAPGQALLPEFNSLQDCAFSQDWKGQLNYWAPPIPLTSRVMRKIIGEQATGILVTPGLSSKWLPALLQLSTAACRFSTEGNTHGQSFALSSENMIAWKISGTRVSSDSQPELESFWSRLVNSKEFEVCSRDSAPGSSPKPQ